MINQTLVIPQGMFTVHPLYQENNIEKISPQGLVRNCTHWLYCLITIILRNNRHPHKMT